MGRDSIRRTTEVKYSSDTVSALRGFTGKSVAETRETRENIYADLDPQGNLVRMSIEHARTNVRLDEFSHREILSTIRS